LLGASRTPDKQANPGYVAEGPILKNRLYFSSAFDYLRSRSPERYKALIQSLGIRR